MFRWQAPAVAAVFVFIVSPLLAERFAGAYTLPFGFSLEGVGIAVLLAWLVLTPNTRIARALSNRFVTHLGVVSYSLYLWQQPFLTSLNTSWLGTPGINLVCALLAAEASYRGLEQPFLALRKRVFPGAVASPA
jgi:peptidoglycan/LPS O-acetylase OafA/YrhL